MPTLDCTECQQKLSITATCCPHCGSTKPFNRIKLTATDSKKLSFKERRSFLKAGGRTSLSIPQKLGLLSLGTFVFVVVIKSNAPLSKEELALKAEKSDLIAARASCQKAIKEVLLLPDSAEFEWGQLYSSTTPLSENKWKVDLKVKSSNAFGTMMPAKYRCTVKDNGEYFFTSQLIPLS